MWFKPAVRKLEIWQGTTFQLDLTWKVEGLPYNLADCVDIRMQIRATQAAPTALADLNIANGGAVITDAAGGSFKLYLSPAQTAALSFDTGVYDVELEFLSTENPANDVYRLLQGEVCLNKEVTRV